MVNCQRQLTEEKTEFFGSNKAQNITAKVMVGGAALTPEYAEEAGADYYASDGVVALNIANEIIGSN